MFSPRLKNSLQTPFPELHKLTALMDEDVLAFMGLLKEHRARHTRSTPWSASMPRSSDAPISSKLPRRCRHRLGGTILLQQNKWLGDPAAAEINAPMRDESIVNLSAAWHRRHPSAGSHDGTTTPTPLAGTRSGASAMRVLILEYSRYKPGRQ
jgi:hypothetical protein